MWRYLRWVLVVVVVAIAVVVALPFMLPTDVYKNQIIAQAKAATGRDLKIDGKLSISFFPEFGVELNGVHFANGEGAHDKDMATIENVVVGAEFWPLLSGDVKVTHITLVKPIINFEIDKQGRGNWVFENGTVAKPEGADSARGAFGELSFKDVAIRGGTVTYRDARTGVIQSAENIDVSVELPSLDEPMTVAGVVTWNKEALNLTGEVKTPRAIVEGGKSDLSAKIIAAVMNASFDGTLDAGGGSIRGKIGLKANSAQRLAAWFHVTLPKVQGFGPLELSGETHASPRQVSFTDAKISLDDAHGTGNLTLDTTRARPFVSGDFSLDRLDVNRYSNRKTGRAAGKSSGWSDSPNDFSALNLVDAKLALSVGSAAWSDMKLGRSQIDLDLKDGVANATFKKLELYGGGGTGTATIDASKAVPEMKVDATLSGINASSFLWDLADLTIVSGTASFVLRLNARGGSERARMQTVTGTGQMQFTGGSVRGVDLAEIAHNITSAVIGNALGPNASTPFSSLSGTFIARDGVAVNRNLTLLNPRVRLDGAGVVNVGARTLNYRVEPKPLGRGPRLPNLGVPVHIFGSWENPQYEPEVGGVVNAAINTVLNTPGDTLDRVGDLLPSIGGDDDKGKKKKKKKGPLDALGDFLGGN
jgi:AsmA protein